jgi:hypothetical protein
MYWWRSVFASSPLLVLSHRAKREELRCSTVDDAPPRVAQQRDW